MVRDTSAERHFDLLGDQGLTERSVTKRSVKARHLPRIGIEGDNGLRGRDESLGDNGKVCVLCGGVRSLAVLELGEDDLSECVTGRRLKELMTGGCRAGIRERGMRTRRIRSESLYTP